jgi:hypothetical protein
MAQIATTTRIALPPAGLVMVFQLAVVATTQLDYDIEA